ncbi:MAG: sugar transporter, partial [Pseudomonadota bacterium]
MSDASSGPKLVEDKPANRERKRDRQNAPGKPERPGRTQEQTPDKPDRPNPKKPQQAQASPPVRKPARRSQWRLRHSFLFFSSLFFVALPLMTVAWYLSERAVDQYASYLGFSVRTEEASSAVELLGGITELSSGSSSDTDILYSYLVSQELVRRVDEQVDLRAMWSKPGVNADPVFTFDPEGTIEDLLDHWERKVTIIYDSGTGLIDLRILAFDPEDARRIATVVLAECTEMINELSAIARNDAIKYAREELGTA